MRGGPSDWTNALLGYLDDMVLHFPQRLEDPSLLFSAEFVCGGRVVNYLT